MLKSIFSFNKFYLKVSFYLAFVACCLALVATIVFASPSLTQATDLRGYFDQSNNINMVLAIIPIVVLLALSMLKGTFVYGKAFSWALVFANFLIYIKTIYMYFAGVFYNGVTAEAFSAVDKGCLVSIILFLVAAILGNVSIYLGNERKVVNHEVKEN